MRLLDRGRSGGGPAAAVERFEQQRQLTAANSAMEGGTDTTGREEEDGEARGGESPRSGVR